MKFRPAKSGLGYVAKGGYYIHAAPHPSGRKHYRPSGPGVCRSKRRARDDMGKPMFGRPTLYAARMACEAGLRRKRRFRA